MTFLDFGMSVFIHKHVTNANNANITTLPYHAFTILSFRTEFYTLAFFIYV